MPKCRHALWLISVKQFVLELAELGRGDETLVNGCGVTRAGVRGQVGWRRLRRSLNSPLSRCIPFRHIDCAVFALSVFFIIQLRTFELNFLWTF